MPTKRYNPLVVLISLFLMTCHSAGAAETAMSPHLSRIRVAIDEVLDDLLADVRVTVTGNSLTYAYQTQKFMVHSIGKDGSIYKKAHEEQGPGYRGFLITLTQQKGTYRGAADIPQDLKRPYWTTYVNAYPTNANSEHIHLNLSYGSGTDRKLLEKIKACISTGDALGTDAPLAYETQSIWEDCFKGLWNKIDIPEFGESDMWRPGLKVDKNILPPALRALITRKSGAVGKGNFKDETWIGAVSIFSCGRVENRRKSLWERLGKSKRKIVSGQIDIRVCNAPSPRAAFEYIILDAGTSTMPVEIIALGFAEERKVAGLGTIGFECGVGDVMFTRDNIAVEVRANGVFAGHSLAIARKIDAKLKQKPRLTYDQLLKRGATVSVGLGKRDKVAKKRDAMLSSITPQGQSVASQKVSIDGKRVVPKDGKFSLEKEKGKVKFEISLITDELIRSDHVIEIDLDELPDSG